MNNYFKFGIASVDITPPLPVRLQGQFYERIAMEVESNLTANVLAMESSGKHFVICSCDLLGVDVELLAKVREKLSVRCHDLKSENLIISATHTHSALECVNEPNELSIGARFLPDNKIYKHSISMKCNFWAIQKSIEYLSEKITDAICAAWESRRQGWYMPAFGRAVIGHCRRAVYSNGSALMYGLGCREDFKHMESGSDTGAELLYLFDDNRNPVAVVVNVACPSQVLEHSRFISSDYWGKARNLLKTEFGQDFVLIGLCSAAGCQSPRDIVRDIVRPESVELDAVNAAKRRHDSSIMWTIKGAEELGRRIRNVVMECLPDAKKELKRQAKIICEKRIIELPLRRVSKEDYEKAHKSYMEKVELADKDIFTRNDMQMLHLDGGTMQRYMLQQKSKCWPAEIVAARIDDMAFLSNPFELFLDYGNQLKAKSPAAQTFIIQLANGYSGYLPTERAQKGGHYSAYIASGMVGHEGGQILVEESLNELNKMF